MANHVRRQLREAIAAAVTGLTTTGTNVFQSRLYPFSVNDLPCLRIVSDGDQVQAQTVNHPYTQMRTTQITIEARAIATQDLDDTLDQICKEVEIAISSAAGIAKSMYLLGTRIEMEALGEQPIGVATMIYSKDLYTASNAPDVVL